MTSTTLRAASHALLDVLLRAALVALLAVACYRVFRPFIDLMIWALILAITLHPLQRRLQARLRLRPGWIATLIVVAAIAILLVPTYLLGMSLVTWVSGMLEGVRAGGVHLPPPPDSVAAWPLIGKRVHLLWSQAASDLGGLLHQFAPQVKHFVLVALRHLAGLGIGLLMFFGALAIAGIFMAHASAGHRKAVAVASRLFGAGKAEDITALCTGTIRAVAQGVVGIAFIQTLLIGFGFVLMDIPAAALLSLAVLLLGIMQVPATLITLPVIVFVFASRGADATTIVFAVYVFVAGLIDNVLKPLLLGRGVPVPMPVVLIGAIGGMVTNGLVGLFTGPVLLAVGYVLFWRWIEDRDAAVVQEASPRTGTDP